VLPQKHRKRRTKFRTIVGSLTPNLDVFGSGSKGCISVGGLRSSGIDIIEGVLIGQESTAARDRAYPIVPADVLANWAAEQAKLLAQASLPDADKARGAQAVLMCGGDVDGLPIARFGGRWLSTKDLVELLADRDFIEACFEYPISYDKDLDF